MSAMRLQELLERWLAENLIDEVQARAVRERLTNERTGAVRGAWYVKVLVACGAWVASLLFVLALLLAGAFGSQSSIAFFGVCFVLAAVGIHIEQRNAKRDDNDFLSQLSLASSLAGHLTLFVWAADWGGSLAVACVLCAGLYAVLRSPTHRFLSCVGICGVALIEVAEKDAQTSYLPLLVAIETATVCLLFSVRAAGNSFWRNAIYALRPAAYAAAVGLVAGLLYAASERDASGYFSFEVNESILKILLIAALLYVCWWAFAKHKSQGLGQTRSFKVREPLALAWTASLALGILSAPGVLAATIFIIIGYARHERPLLALGVLLLPIFLWVFYYSLTIDLMTKSLVLMASGAVLLLARWVAGRREWTRIEGVDWSG